MACRKFDEYGKNISSIKIILHILAGLAMLMLVDLIIALLFDFIFQTTPLGAIHSWQWYRCAALAL